MSAGKREETLALRRPLNRGSLCVFVADNGNQDKVQRETNQHAHAPLRESEENVHILSRFSSSAPDRKEARPKTTKQRPFITWRLTHFLAYALRGIICKA